MECFFLQRNVCVIDLFRPSQVLFHAGDNLDFMDLPDKKQMQWRLCFDENNYQLTGTWGRGS